MNPAIQEFLATRLPFPGLVAWGMRLPEQTAVNQCFSDWLGSSQIDQAVARLAHAAEQLERYSIEPTRLCWRFEHLHLYLARHNNGAWLVLFVANRAESSAASAIDNLLEEFARLPVM